MRNKLTNVNNHGNVVVLTLGGCVIIINIILMFVKSDVFQILNLIAVFTTLFAFAWFKLILLDQYVHSFWLKERMKRDFQCIYGYGVDEYFVITRLSFFTGALVLIFVLLNWVGRWYGIFTLHSACVEALFSCIFICVYCVQLSKYESAFKGVVTPFVSSCMGLLIISIFVWESIALFGLFLFFVYCYIICLKEIITAAKTLEWGDHAIVRVGGKVFDSNREQFYLIFYTKTIPIIILMEDNRFLRRQVDCVESLARTQNSKRNFL